MGSCTKRGDRTVQGNYPLAATTAALGCLVVIAVANIGITDAALSVLPWQVPKDQTLPWQGLENNLPALLGVQSFNNTIVVMLFNEMFTELALNTVASLVLFGKAPNYVVAATNDAAATACRQLRLPCYNATALVDNSVTDNRANGHLKHFSPAWNAVVWGKTIIAAEVFTLGYDLLFTDADVVFIKDAFKAYSTLLETYDADGSFMCEVQHAHRRNSLGIREKKVILNSGNFLLRNNDRTQRLMGAWLGGSQLGYNGNQRYLNLLGSLHFGPANQSLVKCYTRQECTQAKAVGMTAIKCHPVHTEPGTVHLRKWDQLAALRPDLCSDRRAYLHAFGVNVSNSVGNKKEWLQQLGVWMVHIQDFPDKIATVLPSGVLPCPNADAWREDYPELLPAPAGMTENSYTNRFKTYPRHHRPRQHIKGAAVIEVR